MDSSPVACWTNWRPGRDGQEPARVLPGAGGQHHVPVPLGAAAGPAPVTPSVSCWHTALTLLRIALTCASNLHCQHPLYPGHLQWVSLITPQTLDSHLAKAPFVLLRICYAADPPKGDWSLSSNSIDAYPRQSATKIYHSSIIEISATATATSLSILIVLFM